MDLSTTYLGLRLPHPFMPGASPLVDDLDTVRRLEDDGAAAIVMHSLFEEQIRREDVASFLHNEKHGESFAEALYYFPSPSRFVLGPAEYLEQLARIKKAVGVPVIASLNGTSLGGWLDYARQMEQAGADALELNLYAVPADSEEAAAAIERRGLELVRAVKASIAIPVAVKLSPFYTSLSHFARRLDEAGVDGLVLFNRFYHSDIDIENLEAAHRPSLSSPAELPLRLQWLALLSGRLRLSLAVTGGVHDAPDAIKAIMVGAHAVQLVSALLKRGTRELRRIRDEVADWLAEHDYESLDEMRGSMNWKACPDPEVFERANYMMVLQSWRAP